jgi:hypothetical protein
VSDLHPRLSRAREHILNEELSIGSIEFTSAKMNDDGNGLSRRGCDNPCQLAALGYVPHVHSRSSEVQLETDQLATSLPTPDLLDCGILQGIHEQKSHQTRWILRNLCGGKSGVLLVILKFPGTINLRLGAARRDGFGDVPVTASSCFTQAHVELVEPQVSVMAQGKRIVSLGQANAVHKLFKARVRTERIEARPQ